MRESHPSWHTTGDERDPLPTPPPASVPVTAPARVRIGTVAGNRLPGAVIGIFLVLAITVAYTNSLEEIWKAIEPSLGFLHAWQEDVPPPATQSGTTAIPSRERSGSDTEAATTALAQDKDSRPRLAGMAADLTGNSRTSPTPSFSMNEENTARTTESDSTVRSTSLLAQAAQYQVASPGEYTVEENTVSTNDEAIPDETDAGTADDDIPRNPYTVQNGVTRALDAYGLPKDPSEASHAAASYPAVTYPPQQPASGPGISFAVLASIFTMALVGKRMLRMR